MSYMEQHFVRFYSPGTFVAEQTDKKIDAMSVDLAVELAKSIHERYGATPYGFRFVTRARGEDELDSRVVYTSDMYYLGGAIELLCEVKERAKPEEETLLANMEINGWNRIIRTRGAWSWVQPFNDGDTLLEYPE